MRKHLILIGCWTAALVMTLVVSLVTAVFGIFELFYFATVIWAVTSWNQVGVWRYENGISNRPTTLVILFFLFGWPIFFPWYLAMRLKIWTGAARLHKAHDLETSSVADAKPSGLVQPWRGRRI
jgi:hypothetical protein